MDGVDLPNRIKAARILRGMSQDELARKLVGSGLPWRLAGQLERGEVVLRSASLGALCEALQFPERWFMDPVDELCAPPEQQRPTRAELAQQIADLASKLDRVLDLLER